MTNEQAVQSVSKCCKAPITVEENITMYYCCTNCGRACEVASLTTEDDIK